MSSEHVVHFSPSEVHAWVRARLPNLKGRSGATEWRGACPVHQGDRDSFTINFEKGLAYCHSQCATGWNLFTLEQALQGGDDAAARQRVLNIVGRRPLNGAEIVSVYDYVDAKGKLLYQVVRMFPKDFRQRRPDPDRAGKWIWNLRDVKRVLYRLPKILAAPLTQTVFVVEGEKDVHTLEGWNFLATCNAGGAGKWSDDYSRCLKNREVVILPDNDEAGRAHAQQVLDSLKRAGARARMIELSGLPEKGDITDWKQKGGTEEQLKAIVQGEPPAQQQDQSPEGHRKVRFQCDSDGVRVIDLVGHNAPYWICPRLEITARTEDDRGENCGKQVTFTNWKKTQKTAILPLATLVGDGKEAVDRLLSMGFTPRGDKAAINYLKQYMYETNPEKFLTCVDRIGWHKNTFVLPDCAYGPPEEAQNVVFWTDGDFVHKYATSGTLDEWRTSVGSYCRGNSRLLLVVSAAFAATLLDLIQAEGAGLHLRGVSSTGKSTAAYVAGSVAGGDRQKGFLETWRATANGMEACGALHNDMILPLDEISEASEKEVGEVVYALSNGRGKRRMTKWTGQRRPIDFKLIFLSTGEVRLSDKMASAGKQVKGGQEARLIDIEADARADCGLFEKLHGFQEGRTFSEYLVQAAKKCYGTPIRAFLQRLVLSREQTEGWLLKQRGAFHQACCPKDAAGEVKRVASFLGLVAAAGELATEWGITGWEVNEARTAVVRCFNDWVQARGGTGARDIEEGIKAVANFIQVHGASRFQQIERSASALALPNRAGYRAEESNAEEDWEGSVYYVYPTVFESEICRTYDAQAVGRELVNRNVLKRHKGSKNFTIQKRIPGISGKPRYYAIVEQKLFEALNLSTDIGENDQEDLFESEGTVGTKEYVV